MSKKKAISFGIKTARNPSVFAGVLGVFLECIIVALIVMLIVSPVFIWMYGFEAIIGYAIIIGVLLVIGAFIFYEPSKNKSQRKKSITQEKEAINYAKELQNKKFRNKNKNIRVQGKYRRCPKCNSLVIGYHCKYCGFNLTAGEFSTKTTNSATKKKLNEKTTKTKREPAQNSFGIYSDVKDLYDSEMKCPVCGKTIKKQAVRCKYCKTMLKHYR